MKQIQEVSAKIEISEKTKISKNLEVFYNPAMKLNRDLTVMLLNSVENGQMQIADILAGTGVRSIRLMKELNKGKIKKIILNDRFSADKIKINLKLNKVKAEVHDEDANIFLLNSSGFDYIDIDPFGSPNDFLDASIMRLARNGILAVTATDTAALTGSSRSAGLRKYWAVNVTNGFMHESGLRILARKVQLIGTQHEKALIPIFSYAKEHYARIFFRCIKGKEICDELLKQHMFILYNPKTLDYEIGECSCRKNYETIGPLYAGTMNDKKLIRKMIGVAQEDGNKEAEALLNALNDELDIVGSYDLHNLSRVLKKSVPAFDRIIKLADASRVHYNPYAIKTRMSAEELKKIINT